MPKEPNCERVSLVYPKDLCDPKELLSFVQLDPYSASFAKMELTDDEQRKVEIGIMMNPTLSPVIEGTGGIREFEFCTPKLSIGSLHLSAFYAYFPEPGMVVLLDLFQTDDLGEMTAEERAELRALFEECQEWLV